MVIRLQARDCKQAMLILRDKRFERPRRPKRSVG